MPVMSIKIAKRFTDLVVVEIAGSVAGGYAGKLFAGYGATVLLVEPPGGDPQRRTGEPLDGCGTLFAYLHAGKRSVCLDVQTASGRDLVMHLLATADVVIESSSPEPLHPLTSAPAPAQPDRLVRLYLSPFGLTGPYSGYRSTPFTDYAAGGQMFVTGEPDREPIQGAGRQPEYAAGTYGFIATMASLYYREQSGSGQLIDVSHMEAMASMHQWTSVKYTHTGTIERRIGNRYSSAHPITIYPCKDGHVAVSAASDEAAARLLAVSGYGHLLADPRYATGLDRLQHADEFDAEIRPWLMSHTAEEIVRISQEVRVPVGPVPGMLALLDDAHLGARDFWDTVQVGDRALRYPGPPFKLSAHPWQPAPPPAPGAETGAVLRSVGATHLGALRQSGISGSAGNA
jgi:crotonobetainyl-CoA:carnitine CoA-transferase CaiB-like acyl-CoA transferase